jgi:energy-coupling factor transporter ATP-binding protein EcfA2
MNHPKVRFKEIKIDRALGIRRGAGFAVCGLSEGINLVFGPNGSGKSTTARVIQELLWPGRTGLERPSISGQFRVGEEAWSAEIDAGHPEYSCNGRAGAVLAVGPPGARSRYRLALDELMGDDNPEFAKAIADESQGGFDLEAAARDAGIRDRPPSRGQERRKVEASRARVEQARSRQKEIEGDAAQLAQLRSDRDRSISAQQELESLQRVVEYRQATEQSDRLQFRLSRFPAGVGLLDGDELEELDRLETEIARLEREKIEQQNRIHRSEADLESANLDRDGSDPRILPELRAWQLRLSSVEAEIRQQRSRLVEAGTAAERALTRLGTALEESQLDSLETVEIESATEFGREAARVRGQEKAAREMQRWLVPEGQGEDRGPGSDLLKEGIGVLGRWLSSPDSENPKASGNWLLVAASVLAGVLGLVLAYLEHPAWAVTLIAALLLVAAGRWIDRRSGGGQASSPRRVHRGDFERMDLPQPAAWEESEVNRLLSELIRLTVSASLEEERIRRCADLESRLDEISSQRQLLEERRQAIEASLGLKAAVSDEWLPVLIENLAVWQRSRDFQVSLEESVRNLDEERDSLARTATDLLEPLGYRRIQSAEALALAIDDLSERQNRCRNASSDLKDARERIEEGIEPRLAETASRHHAVFHRLELAEGDRTTVQEWLRMRADYQELSSQLTQATAVVEDRRRALEGQDDLLELDPVTLQQRIEEQKELALRRDQLSERIAAINQAIQLAKEGHELSEALEESDEAIAGLERGRDQNRGIVVGGILKEWVRGESIERSRPEVFRRANELLARFTQGTLQVELEDRGNPPRFLARQGSLPARPVDELSTGERIQLLMAVRIAFIEQDEPAVLPLLMDETLGTSDDSRARVIMDAVVELARNGRQIFYFTAQEDELGKWKARLNDSGVPHQVVDLTQVRQIDMPGNGPLEIAPVRLVRPLPPEGMSYQEYGRLLQPPPIDPFGDSPDRLHLWHVLDDPQALFDLLSKDISNLGQLRTLIEHGGAGLIDGVDGQYELALAAARAVEAACSAWRIGRARPVGRAELQASGCVSEVFLQEVAELAKTLGGDAGALIHSLEQGQISRWRVKSTEALRAFFEQEGFLPDSDLLTEADIRLRVMAAVADELKSGIVGQALIDRIVASLPRG